VLILVLGPAPVLVLLLVLVLAQQASVKGVISGRALKVRARHLAEGRRKAGASAIEVSRKSRRTVRSSGRTSKRSSPITVSNLMSKCLRPCFFLSGNSSSALKSRRTPLHPLRRRLARLEFLPHPLRSGARVTLLADALSSHCLQHLHPRVKAKRKLPPKISKKQNGAQLARRSVRVLPTSRPVFGHVI